MRSYSAIQQTGMFSLDEIDLIHSKVNMKRYMFN